MLPVEHTELPEHVEPAQHGWVGPPQPTQLPAAQTVLAPEHDRSLPMQVFEEGSQQSPGDPAQELPAQHAAPVVPHATQVPPEHSSALPEHVLPAQQGWFTPPHATHVPAEHSSELPVHALPEQHG